MSAESQDAINDASLPEDDPRLLHAVQEYLEALEAGSQPSRAALVARHPDLAVELGECLDALEFVHSTAPRLDATPGPERGPGPLEAGVAVGDFRILREIGRGGMGVVYEAEQLSLGRRIALKVLPLAQTLDARHLRRFKTEAQAAACLHHPNIVPVYSVGCDRGVHYYAMQFIEGRSLAEVIAEMRKRRAAPAEAAPSAETAVLAATGRIEEPDAFRAAARLGVQAAAALDHAHEMGVVHRDVKPANLMLDATGRLWVADFGLAQLPDDAALTMSGDVLGTLRYMSPEQTLGRRGAVDHRTDVYGLGATLYELLTLEPPFAGRDRHELLRQIGQDEPRPLRQLNRAAPPELATIVHKALARLPQERYTTAAEMAADLQRFLDDRPILARPPSLLQRAAKWVRRHRSLAASAVILLVTATAALAVSTIVIAGEQARTKAAYQQLAAEQARTKAAYEAEAEQRAQAEQNFLQAREAVDAFVAVCEQELSDSPALQDLRKRLLETALTYYQDFIELRRDDPQTQTELTTSQFRLAGILAEIGTKAEARAALEQARKLEAKLLREKGLPPGYGRGFWGFGPPPPPPAEGGAVALLAARSVQTELKLSPSQIEEVDRLATKYRDAHWDARALEPPEARTLFDGLASQEKALVEKLRPEQARRLKQIALQQRGGNALADSSVAEGLGLSAEQRERIRSLLPPEGRRPRPGPGFGGPGSDQRRRPPEKPPSIDAVLNVLTPEQKARWNEMTGEPFRGELGPGPGGPGPGRDHPRPSRP
jgi:serine/threonine protein kinase